MGMDVAFIVMLFLTSLTGMALLLLRETAAMGPLLALHLGVVFSLFITMPYGKFVHGIYRFVALVRYARERQMMGHGAETCRHCEERSDEAIHSFRRGEMDCFVASLLAMTTNTASRSRDTIRPSFAENLVPPKYRGRREDRVPVAPAARVHW